MDPVETSGCSEFADEVNRYAWGELREERGGAIEAHLNECASCRELATFTKNLIDSMREDSKHAPPVTEPCPDASLIVALEAEKLDELTAKHVAAHILHCNKCREAYLMLRGLNAEKLRELAFSDADTDVLRLRRLASDDLLDQIRALHETVKSQVERGAYEVTRALEEARKKAAELLLEIERAFLDPLKKKEDLAGPPYYYTLDNPGPAYTILGHLREVERAYIRMALAEYLRERQVEFFCHHHMEGLRTLYIEEAFKHVAYAFERWAEVAELLGDDRTIVRVMCTDYVTLTLKHLGNDKAKCAEFLGIDLATLEQLLEAEKSQRLINQLIDSAKDKREVPKPDAKKK